MARPARTVRYTWVIDPLDGTSNYLRGFPHYCVSIALVDNGEPTDGVIFDPLRNELFTASRGSGAQLNERRIRVSDRKDLAGATIGTGFAPRERARAGAQLECVRELLVQAEDVRRTGSAALDLAYVACGRSDAYFEAGREGLGHRRWRAAGARSRRQGLRLPRRQPSAPGFPGRQGPPGRGRQHQGLRGVAEAHRVLGLRRQLQLKREP